MWYYVRNNQQTGPVPAEELSALITSGTVTRETLVWTDGMKDWVPAQTTELAPQFAALPAVIPGALPADTGAAATPPAVAGYYEPESFRVLWLWFAWLLGAGIPLLFILIGIIPLIAGTVVGYILLYRFWDIIQDGRARTTPGKAVGFCFIPFYNFYWCYVAIVGLAKDMNAYCDARGLALPRVNESLALAWFILSLCSIIPYAGIIACVGNLVLTFIVYKQLTDIAAGIVAAKQG